MVSYRTRIAIAAVATFQDLVDAPLLAGALITGAGISIVAKREILSVYEIRLVDVAITIVINPIARLSPGQRCITIRQTTFKTDPLPVTDSKIVFHLAICR